MALLIIIVTGLSLMAITVANSVSSFSLEDHEIKYAAARADVGLLMLEGTVESYLRHSVDQEGRIVYPGDGVDLGMDLAPLHGYIPSEQLYGIQWSVRTGHYRGVPAVGICATPLNNGTVTVKAIDQVATSLPAAYVVLASDCFAQSGQANGGTLTYWLEVSAFDDASALGADVLEGAGERSAPAQETLAPVKGCSVKGNCFGHLKNLQNLGDAEAIEPIEPVVGYTGSSAREGYAKARKQRCDALSADPRKNSNWNRLLKACIQ